MVSDWILFIGSASMALLLGLYDIMIYLFTWINVKVKTTVLSLYPVCFIMNLMRRKKIIRFGVG